MQVRTLGAIAMTVSALAAACGGGGGASTSTQAPPSSTSETPDGQTANTPAAETTVATAAEATTTTTSVAVSEAPDTGPEVVFERTFGGEGMDRGVGIIETADGGFAVVGVTAGGDLGGEDVLLLRLDSEGNEKWSRTYGGERDDAGWSVVETQDAGFVIAGFTSSQGAGGIDVLVIGTDGDGNQLWESTFGGAGDDLGWGVSHAGDGGFVVVGETTSFGAGGQDAYLIRIDAEGREVWTATYGGEANDRSFAIVAVADGGFALAGITTSSGSGGRDAHVIKVDESGGMVWEATSGDGGDDVAHAVDLIPGDGLRVFGYTNGFGARSYDVRVFDLDSSGREVESSTFGGSGEDRVITGTVRPGGNSVMVGYTTSAGEGRRDAYLVETDGDGPVWSMTFGGPTDDAGYTVIGTRDGGAALTGHVSNGGQSTWDVLVVRVAPG